MRHFFFFCLYSLEHLRLLRKRRIVCTAEGRRPHRLLRLCFRNKKKPVSRRLTHGRIIERLRKNPLYHDGVAVFSLCLLSLFRKEKASYAPKKMRGTSPTSALPSQVTSTTPLFLQSTFSPTGTLKVWETGVAGDFLEQLM